MHAIKHILSRYTLFIWGLLQPLGSWGVFAIAAIDGALLGMPLDPMVAGYVYQHPPRFLLCVIMAAAGSTVGSIVLYVIGYKGGEVLLLKRISRQKFDKMRASFDRHEFWALMVPAMIPPPFPFKVFVLSAAVFEMHFGHFLLAIFSGRFVRFIVLALLTMKFGPEIVNITGDLVGHHLTSVLLAIVAAVGLWVIVKTLRGRKAIAGPKA